MDKIGHYGITHECESTRLLSRVLANTYALYLKTQNYHWNVEGAHFYMLHLFFESQYEALAEAVDTLAERIRALGERAPGTFSSFQRLMQVEETDELQSAEKMIINLLKAHDILIESLREGIRALTQGGDEGTVDLFTERLRAHEKMTWMLKSHLLQESAQGHSSRSLNLPLETA